MCVGPMNVERETETALSLASASLVAREVTLLGDALTIKSKAIFLVFKGPRKGFEKQESVFGER